MSEPAEIDRLPERPYPGLRAFQQHEWAIFFGREEHADDVVTELSRNGLVLVHGASGCGKSSLIRAGVLPTLETDHEIDRRIWRTATMRPSEGLLTRLAALLEEVLPSADTGRRPWAELVVQGAGLVDQIEAALRDAGGGSLCLLIDQFEEIFRWARERSIAEVRTFVAFLKNVRRPEEPGGLNVVLTMRSDYLGQCAAYDGFAEFLNKRQFMLPRIDEFGLLRSIHEPALLYGGDVDPALAAKLLPAVSAELDGLPVLAHALMRASDRARGHAGPGAPWIVTADDLAAIGGAEHALARHADEVLAAATGGDPRLVEAAEWMFRSLTDLDADRRAIRRPSSLRELIEVSGVDRDAAIKVLDAFRAPEVVFISPYLPSSIDDDSELDISHEALIRQWPRLCNRGINPKTSRPYGWIFREFHDGMVWRSLAVQAEAFGQSHHHLLSVATTEQRLPFFHAVRKRQSWTARHALLDDTHAPGAVERQWDEVEAMMRASEFNMTRERSLVFRLRRRNLITLFVAAIACVSLAGMLAFRTKAIQSKARLAAAQEAIVQRQHDELVEQAKQFRLLLNVGSQLAASTCAAYHFTGAKFDQCRKDLVVQVSDNIRFRTGLTGAMPAMPEAAAVPAAPARSSSRPPPAAATRQLGVGHVATPEEMRMRAPAGGGR